MKKVWLWLLVFLFGTALSTGSVCASELMEDLKASAGLERLEEIVPYEIEGREELLAGVGNDSYASADAAAGLLESFLSLVRESVSSEAKLFASLFLVLALSAFFSAMRQAWFRDSVGDAVDLLSVLVLSGVSYHAIWSLFETVRETLTLMSSFVSSMLPVTAAVYSLSGGVVTSTVQSSLMLLALSVLDALCTTYLVPLVCVSFSLSCANAVSGVDFSALCRFLRKTVTVVLSVIFLILLAILSVQSVLAAASDNLTLRSARYAAANFIPAVGGMFSEAAKTVFSALGVLRTSLGTLAIVIICWFLLRPLVFLLVRRALFSILSSVAQAFSLERESRFLSECSETLGLGLGIVFSAGVFFLLAFGVFLCIPLGG